MYWRMQKWETNVCQCNESFIIRVHNFVEQLLNRYVCIYLIFLQIKYFNSFVSLNPPFLLSGVRTPVCITKRWAHLRTITAPTSLVTACTGLMWWLVYSRYFSCQHSMFTCSNLHHLQGRFIVIFCRTSKTDINGEGAAVVTSHRGEDGVRGVEAAGGVGAAEAPVRPPVQHLYSAVQCTPVQYSTAQHQPQHPAAGRHHGHGRRLPPGAPPVTSEGQVRGALVSRGLQFSYRCTCTMIFTILGESAYCRVSTCPLNEFLIFAILLAKLIQGAKVGWCFKRFRKFAITSCGCGSPWSPVSLVSAVARMLCQEQRMLSVWN